MADQQSKQSGQIEFHELMLKEIRTGMREVREDVSKYRDENIHTQARLSEHITSCDRRWAAAQKTITDNTPQANHIINPEPGSALISKKRIMRKLLDKALDYAILVLICMAVFAFRNGFKPPLPDSIPSQPSTTHGP
jgi:hypothetical protein